MVQPSIVVLGARWPAPPGGVRAPGRRRLHGRCTGPSDALRQPGWAARHPCAPVRRRPSPPQPPRAADWGRVAPRPTPCPPKSGGRRHGVRPARLRRQPSAGSGRRRRHPTPAPLGRVACPHLGGSVRSDAPLQGAWAVRRSGAPTGPPVLRHPYVLLAGERRPLPACAGRRSRSRRVGGPCGGRPGGGAPAPWRANSEQRSRPGRTTTAESQWWRRPTELSPHGL